MEDFNGEILVNGNILLSPNYTLEEFKKSDLYDENKNTSIFFWVDKTCELEDHKFGIGLYFKDGKLNFIHLYCMDDNIRDENERTRFHQEFVQRIAKKNEYDWGEIDEFLDPREGYSIVIISYK